MIVLDASALLDVLLENDRAPGVSEHLSDESIPLVAPDHMLVETTRSLRRFALANLISEENADRQALNALGLGVRTYPCRDLLPRAWTMKSSITIDDALYVALAESVEGARLLTTDRRLANAASGRVEVIAL
ncbi:MAG: type II toxin-antitoxin system VapC family toxin [Solirubrobacterales bacterium]|nr:type II toxin-antitoxin system VapC family toxin [Solirubrobacterales bacterium]